MSTLMVTPFAPQRDGIATYALQELRRLRRGGERVEVLSPEPSAARWHLPLGGPIGMGRLVAKAGDHDRVILQFGPELAFGRCRTSAERVAVWAGLEALARRRPLEIRLHEIEYGPLEHNPIERRAARRALAAAGRVTVHTEVERAAVQRRLGRDLPIEVVAHGRDFEPAIRRDRTGARTELGLPDDEHLFLAIGFLQHHKGFDRAVDAFGRIDPGGEHPARLDIVGSARVDHPDIRGHVQHLRIRCGQVAGATLHERFVSDVEFDLWLQAADTVLLPYREIWSSGVLERARLFGVPIIAADLPSLRDQAPLGTVFAADVDELAVAMDKMRSVSTPASTPGAGGPSRNPADPGSGPNDPMRAPGADGPGCDEAASTWVVDPRTPDRVAIQRQIADRARAATVGVVDAAPDDGRRAVDGLAALGPLHRPTPTSARPGVAPVKRIIQRVIGWQIDPLAIRIEELQRAATDAVARVEGRLDATTVTPIAGSVTGPTGRPAGQRVDRADGAPADGDPADVAIGAPPPSPPRHPAPTTEDDR